MIVSLRRICPSVVLLMGMIASSLLAESQAPVATLDLQDGDCVVFLGDSITHQRLYTQYVEDFFFTRYPTKRIQLHNAGVGGATAWDALARFDRDVAAYQPKYVTVLLGMNDGRYQSYNEKIWQTYHNDMSTLIERLVDINAVPVLITPTMYDSRAALARKKKPAENYNSVLAYYGTWLREVAVNQGFGFVDMWGPLNNLTLDQRKTEPDFTLIPDSVHPGPAGQLVMAFAIIQDLDLGGDISSIQIITNAEGEAETHVSGGQISDLQTSSTSIQFTWTANSLPWVVPAEAQAGAKLLNMGHRASRESLGVHGLRPGKYDLSIDGQSVGTYSDIELAHHIELQDNDKTPQYRQALQVAELNKQRNKGPIGQLRGEWSQFQQFARTRRQVSESPDNEELVKRLSDLEQRLEGREERIVRYEAAAKELEDKIFEINQPAARRYVLQRTSD